MPCIFCGREVTKEHVYRRALIEKLAPDANGFTNTISMGYGEAEPVSTWASEGADVTVNCLCSDCNSGWTNEIDQSAEEMVILMCRGETNVRLVDGALEAFTTWAIKMGIVISGLQRPYLVRQEDREYFYAERKPSAGFKVWVATMQSYDEGETRTHALPLMSSRDSGEAVAFLSTFRVLHLVVQVLAPINPDIQPEHDEWGSQHAELAWPRASRWTGRYQRIGGSAQTRISSSWHAHSARCYLPKGVRPMPKLFPHSPNIIAPRHRGLTLTPVWPRVRYSTARP